MADYVLSKKPGVTLTLKNPALQLQSVRPDFDELYQEELIDVVRSEDWENRTLEDCQYWQKELQKIINRANDKAENLHKSKFFYLILNNFLSNSSFKIAEKKAVQLLNEVLEKNIKGKFYDVLTDPRLEVSNLVDEFAISLYYKEMREDRIVSKVQYHLYFI